MMTLLNTWLNIWLPIIAPAWIAGSILALLSAPLGCLVLWRRMLWHMVRYWGWDCLCGGNFPQALA